MSQFAGRRSQVTDVMEHVHDFPNAVNGCDTILIHCNNSRHRFNTCDSLHQYPTSCHGFSLDNDSLNRRSTVPVTGGLVTDSSSCHLRSDDGNYIESFSASNSFDSSTRKNNSSTAEVNGFNAWQSAVNVKQGDGLIASQVDSVSLTRPLQSPLKQKHNALYDHQRHHHQRQQQQQQQMQQEQQQQQQQRQLLDTAFGFELPYIGYLAGTKLVAKLLDPDVIFIVEYYRVFLLRAAGHLIDTTSENTSQNSQTCYNMTSSITWHNFKERCTVKRCSTSSKSRTKPTSGPSSSRTRRPRQLSPVADQEPHKIIYIWKLEDILCVCHSLLVSRRGQQHGKFGENVTNGMNELIESIADRFFCYSQFEESHLMHINDILDNNAKVSAVEASSDTLIDSPNYRQVSPLPNVDNGLRLRKRDKSDGHIQRTYGAFRQNATGLFASDFQRRRWLSLKAEIDMLVGQWHALIRQAITLANSRPNCRSVIVTENHLIIALVQLLLFDLGDQISVDDIFSCTAGGEKRVFDRIYEEYGAKNTYVIIGNNGNSGNDGEHTTQKKVWPFWTIRKLSDIAALHRALSLGIM